MNSIAMVAILTISMFDISQSLKIDENDSHIAEKMKSEDFNGNKIKRVPEVVTKMPSVQEAYINENSFHKKGGSYEIAENSNFKEYYINVQWGGRFNFISFFYEEAIKRNVEYYIGITSGISIGVPIGVIYFPNKNRWFEIGGDVSLDYYILAEVLNDMLGLENSVFDIYGSEITGYIGCRLYFNKKKKYLKTSISRVYFVPVGFGKTVNYKYGIFALGASFGL